MSLLPPLRPDQIADLDQAQAASDQQLAENVAHYRKMLALVGPQETAAAIVVEMSTAPHQVARAVASAALFTLVRQDPS